MMMIINKLKQWQIILLWFVVSDSKSLLQFAIRRKNTTRKYPLKS